MNVFAIVQALSLGAMECLWLVLLYGLEFHSATVLMFNLGWYEVHRHIFPSLRRSTDPEKHGKWNRFETQIEIVDPSGSSLLSIKLQVSCQLKGQPLTVSCPASYYHSDHLRQLWCSLSFQQLCFPFQKALDVIILIKITTQIFGFNGWHRKMRPAKIKCIKCGA